MKPRINQKIKKTIAVPLILVSILNVYNGVKTFYIVAQGGGINKQGNYQAIGQDIVEPPHNGEWEERLKQPPPPDMLFDPFMVMSASFVDEMNAFSPAVTFWIKRAVHTMIFIWFGGIGLLRTMIRWLREPEVD